jgi:hypothetical protein
MIQHPAQTHRNWIVIILLIPLIIGCRRSKATQPIPTPTSVFATGTETPYVVESVLPTLTPEDSPNLAVHTPPFPILTTSPQNADYGSTPVLLPAQATYIPGLIVTPSPTVFLTPTPLYRRYLPDEKSLFRFEFEYPSRWVRDDLSDYETFASISFVESIPSGGDIILAIEINGASMLTDTIDETLGRVEIEELDGKLHEDKNVRIDGYSARWI